MRQTVISRKLNALRIDHDQANILGKRPHKKTHDDRVDHDRLTRASGACDKQMRHLGQIRHDRGTLSIAADSELKRSARNIRQDIAQIDILTRAIGDLDSDKRGTRNRSENTHSSRCKRKRDIVFQIGNSAHALTLTGLHLKCRDRWSGNPANYARMKTKLAQRRLKRRRSLLKLLRRGSRGGRCRVMAKYRHRRKLTLAISTGRNSSLLAYCSRKQWL